jgi:hypothetical protein
MDLYPPIAPSPSTDVLEDRGRGQRRRQDDAIDDEDPNIGDDFDDV